MGLRDRDPRDGGHGVRFAASLEERARRLLRDRRFSDVDAPLLPIIRHDIQLTLDHVNGLRGLQREQLRSILRIECYTDTELMNTDPKPSQYFFTRRPDREKLRERLARLEQERRRLSLSMVERIQTLHDRLLILLNRHAQLTG